MDKDTLHLKARKPKRHELDAAQIKYMYVQEGKSIAAIRAELSVGRTRLTQFINEIGVKRRPRGTRPDKDRVIRMYTADKLSVKHIAKALDASQNSVSKILRKAQVMRRSNKRKAPVNKKQLMHFYIHNQFPMRKIAKILGVSTSTIANRLDDYGVETQPHRTSPERLAKIELIKRLYLEELNTSEEIAQKLRMSSSAVCRYLKKAGIPIRGRWGTHKARGYR